MEIYKFLCHLHDRALELGRYLKFDKTHPRHLHLIGLYGSLIELVGSLTVLIENGNRTGVPHIFRGILEAYVEFKNLSDDADYGYYMEAANHQQWIRLLRGSQDAANPYLSEIANAEASDSMLKTHEDELAALKEKGFAPLTILARFQRADMEHEYRSIYNFMSAHSHSNIRALVERHLDLSRKDFEVVFYKEASIESYLTYVDTAAGLLVDATRRIHEFLETDVWEEASELVDELQAARKADGYVDD